MIKKRLTKLYYCGWLFLLSQPAIAFDLSHWQLVTEVTVAPNSSQILQITNDNFDIDLAVIKQDSLLSVQNGPESRLGLETLVLDATDQSVNFKIFIRPTQQSEVPLQWSLNQLPSPTTIDVRYFRALYQANILWKSDMGNQRDEALSLLYQAVALSVEKPKYHQQALLIQAHMLLKTEQYTAAFDTAAKVLVSRGEFEISEQIDHLWLKAKWIQAEARLQLDEPQSANELYGELVNSFDFCYRDSGISALVEEDIRGDYGLTWMHRGYLRGHKGGVKKGKVAIDRAMLRINALQDFALQAKLLNHLWTFYSLNNQHRQAEKALLLGLNYIEKTGSDAGKLDLLNNLSLTYRWTGRITEAQQRLRQALALVSTTNQADTSATLYNNLAGMYGVAGDYNSAKRFYLRALQINQDNSAKRGVAMVYKGLGKIAREQGYLKLAIDYHSKSLAYFKTVSDEHAARLLIELSRDHFLAGDFWLAKQSAERALNLPGDIVLANDIIDSLIIFAKIAWHEGNNEAFLAHLARIQTEFKDKISPEHRLELTRLQIEHSLKSGDVEHLTAFADAAIAEIEKVRQSLDTARLGPAWTNKTDGLVSQYIAALMQLAKRAGHQQLQQKVFQILAQNHAINLRERRYMLAQNSILTNNTAKSSQKDQQLILLWERSLQAERLIVSAGSKSAKKQAMNQADDAREAYLTYAPQLAGNEADADLAYLSIDEIQAKLQPTEMFIRYYVRDNITFAFVITADGWQVMDIPEREVLMEQGQRLISALKKQQLVPDGAIRTLTKLLPLKMLSKGTYRRLIIVHDDILNTFPFSALNIAVVAARYKPLVSEYEIVRAYSAAEYFADNVLIDRPHKYDIAVFADPVFDKESFLKGERNSVEPDQYRSWAKSLSRLPSTAKEAAAIGEIYAGAKIKIVMGVAATNQMLMSDDMRNAGILHIASHGYFSESTPDIVGIATSVIDEHNNDSPGFLTLTELLSKPFSSRLVVVSGCETLLGKQLNGEGLNGLTRGLLSQGAGSVISTLWSIPDKPTAEFMKTFYTYLKQHNGNSVKALNLTKVKFSRHKRYRHPLYWAGFVLTAANKRFALPEQ